MKLRDFRLFTDENVSTLVVEYLRGEGFDVIDVGESGWQGEPDEQQMSWAFADGRVVVTHDTDIGQLAWTGNQPFHGVLTIRPGDLPAPETIELIRALLHLDPELPDNFLLIAKNVNGKAIFRIRQGIVP